MDKFVYILGVMFMLSACVHNGPAPKKTEAVTNSTATESISTEINTINKGIADRVPVIK